MTKRPASNRNARRAPIGYLSRTGRELAGRMPPGTVLPPIYPSAAMMAAYAGKLDRNVEAMHRSAMRFLVADYRANNPHLALDASPARALRSAMRAFSRRWQRKFDELADNLATYFARETLNRTDGEFKTMLRDAGFTVRFTMTKAMNDAYQAVIGENVGLIKSIAAQHLSGVEGLVMRAVQVGGDLQVLVDGLEKQYGITRRRAQSIARSQTRMATATLTRARQIESGFTKAKWLHSAGGKTPRPEHVKFSGEIYDIAEGHDFKNGEGTVWPGVPINCRCVSCPVIPGTEGFD